MKGACMKGVIYRERFMDTH